MHLYPFQTRDGTLFLRVEVPVDENADPRVDNDKDFTGASVSRLFDHPLNCRSVNDREHRLGKGPRGRTHASAATGGGYDSYFNIHGLTSTSAEGCIGWTSAPSA